MKKYTGSLIAIDGTDGSGKKTQAELLVLNILAHGRGVKSIDFPRYNNNFTGAFLAECLGKKPGAVMPVDTKAFIAADPRLVSIPYALDRMESKREMEEWLEQGLIVISDRYTSANQIHQGGKIHDTEARTRFLEWLDKLEFEICGIPRPDLIVYLNVPIETSMKLARERALATGGSPDAAEEDAKHQHESRESALAIVESLNNWVKVDCVDEKGDMLPREVIAERVFAAVSHLL